VGGAELAGQAIRAGLVDEIDLELLDERRFGSGVVYLRYRTRA
jgi:riboflavin biosynthesis pyrimidine reductase